MSIATYPIKRVAPPSHDVVGTLERGCVDHGIDQLANRLADLRTFLASDLDEVDRLIASVGANGKTVAEASVRHLLSQDGKRIRPICVALAAHVGRGFSDSARTYAVAVELVHNATLLHDDVVDLGVRRRGAEAARMIYGNAASIFGGDWLLVEALRDIQRVGNFDVLGRMLDVVREMVIAESIQLERRGKLDTTVNEYFQIVEGKTASLFRWAMFAGAVAGGVSDVARDALVDYGRKVGVAFQVVDDVLDVAGDAETTGKNLLADLAEGKMTYPMLRALERRADLAPLLEVACAGDDVAPEVGGRIISILRACGVVDECLDFARRLCNEAIASLDVVPDGMAKTALVAVAKATPERRK
jgi:octaprenyl-diphosphate synthase